MKRACHVLVLSTALTGGGAEEVARLMVERLENSWCLLFENNAGITVPGHNVWVIPMFLVSTIRSKLLVNIWRLFYVQAVKFMLRPDVTISHLEGPNFANILTWWGGRRIIFVHNLVSRNYQQGRLVDRLKRGLVRWLYRRADSVFCVSSDICTELIDDFGASSDRVEILPNPIDFQRIRENSWRTYGDARDRLCGQRYLVSIASLTRQKNHELLLRAFSELVQAGTDHPDLKLVLVGEGEEKQRLHSLCSVLGLKFVVYGVDDLNLSAQVFFMGFQPDPYPLLRYARLLVMPSLWEGSPIALLEAMALGTPAIAANCSAGVRDILLQNSGSMSSTIGEYERTPFGVLVHNPVGSEQASIQLWAELIRDTLDDCQYLAECSKNAPDRARKHDVYSVSRIWQERLLSKS